MPELLRVKGNLVRAAKPGAYDEAESYLGRSLEMSRDHGVPGWEMRAAIDLAALLAARGQYDSARALLQPLAERFAEGLDTADLKSAGRLLATLR
ncbi:tetratricopeptide repeat protein [Mesorhizobium sp.]